MSKRRGGDGDETDAEETIDDVMVCNVQVLSWEKPLIHTWSFDENSWIDHVTISGLNILGEEVLSFEQLDYEASLANVENIGIPPSVNK